MWNWKPAKAMLERSPPGDLVIAGRQGFQRLYDLPERVIPEEVLAAPAPTRDEFVRWATLAVSPPAARSPRPGSSSTGGCEAASRASGRIVDALVADGALAKLAVADGGAPVIVPAGARPGGNVPPAVLLSPFDNLLWDRPFRGACSASTT